MHNLDLFEKISKNEKAKIALKSFKIGHFSKFKNSNSLNDVCPVDLRMQNVQIMSPTSQNACRMVTGVWQCPKNRQDLKMALKSFKIGLFFKIYKLRSTKWCMPCWFMNAECPNYVSYPKCLQKGDRGIPGSQNLLKYPTKSCPESKNIVMCISYMFWSSYTLNFRSEQTIKLK